MSLERNMSLGNILQMEKQISVDPISVNHRVEFTMSPPTPLASFKNIKLLSYSLPNSPGKQQLKQVKSKKKKHGKDNTESRLARQHSVAISNLERLRESHLRRSKSCGEGRASQPSLDFDIVSKIGSKMTTQQKTKQIEDTKNQEIVFVEEEETNKNEDKVKPCGALCLFLPGFGKGKPVGKSKRDIDQEEDQNYINNSSSNHSSNSNHSQHNVVSHRVSLEKFECGSWRSSAIINIEEDGDNGNFATSSMFFDLPMELIRSTSTSVNDTDYPVTAAFVFDNNNSNNNNTRKGVLKTRNLSPSASSSSSSTRLLSNGQQGMVANESSSSDSMRHVRFSTSSPTEFCTNSSSGSCVTPRLRKARDEFNAFLEAQNA